MVDSVSSLATRFRDLLVTNMTHAGGSLVPGQGALLSATSPLWTVPQDLDVTRDFQELTTRATALGSHGMWLAAAGHAGLAAQAIARGQTRYAVLCLTVAVAFGYNDCVALHAAAIRPLHDLPQFQDLYRQIRVTPADLAEFLWLRREMQTLSRDAQRAGIENLRRQDSRMSVLPQAPMPDRDPNTNGILITRFELAAARIALQQALMQSDIARRSDNLLRHAVSERDHSRARRDSWHAHLQESQLQLAAPRRAFIEDSNAHTTSIPCPPLGSIPNPG
ncbi:hypothetical protein [Kitasatospora sp. NPDC056181]|uniref:hypothetical protein n=1 Tax=Kitasatospora sp. NPDC056181 TaxID=3345737 RepID=UPI0035E085B7